MKEHIATITLLGIGLGTIVMFMAVLRTRKLRALLLSGPNSKKWQLLIYLMIFFLAGYGVAIALVITEQIETFLLVTGSVFFAGALFVFLVVNTTKSDVKWIKEADVIMRQKNAELEKTNTELDMFAYRVSHDLRGPIASIRGLVQIVKTARSKDEADFCLDKIEASTVKLDGFIQDILDLSRNARTDVAFEPVNVRALVDEVIASVHYIDPTMNTRILLSVPPSMVVTTDPLRLRLIMNNLITNAYKYRDEKKPASVIEIQCEDVLGKFRLAVKDNGIGISEEHREKIFEMFFRGTNLSAGTGLGLYVVKQVVEKLHGTIEVDTTLGEGSQFVVELKTTAGASFQ